MTMQRHLVTTSDGSHSIYVPALDEHYHSRHGAIQESLHVFLKMGWDALPKEKATIDILEIGFGTGLNALLTAFRATDESKQVRYATVEAFPLSAEEYLSLNYGEETLRPDATKLLRDLHEAKWESLEQVLPGFDIWKMEGKIEAFEPPFPVDLIFFDAFAPNKQPELWTEEVFAKMHCNLKPGGLLVTYCAKGDVKRAMKAAGFRIEKVAGPPGKREMIRGWKDGTAEG